MTTRMERRNGKSKSGGARAAKHALRAAPTPVKIAIIAGIVLVLALTGLAYAVVNAQSAGIAAKKHKGKESPLPRSSIVATDGADASSTLDASGSPLASAGVEVEVPDVIGKRVEEAEIVLQSVGFTVKTRVADRMIAGLEPGVVVAISPPAGTRLKPGSDITITYNPKVDQPSNSKGGVAGRVVCIDAGHQRRADLTLEPIGPGSTETKAKVAGGGTGVVTRVPEHQRALEVSLKLRDKLQAAGINVVMVRTSSDVNVANSERAKIGNRAGAAITVRVHFDSSSTQSVRGISTLYPAGNGWCDPIEPESKRAATLVEDAVCAATGAKKRGIFGRGDMTGFNWSTVPTIIVESGFLSNPDDDKAAASAAYQDKIAQGIADGVIKYLTP